MLLHKLVKRIYCLTSTALLLSLAGCAPSYLSLYTRYISEETLASYYVNTPDPSFNCPPIGQRLILTWSVPKSFLNYEMLIIELTIRFRNHEEIIQRLQICERRGTYVYDLMNTDYLATKGIATYRADLLGDGSLLEEWRHEMWAPLITVTPQKTEESVPLPEDWGDINDDF